MKSIVIKGKTLDLPAFFPDATRGVIRSLDSVDLVNAKVPGLVVNTYHLLSQPGTEIISNYDGIKKFMNWEGFIITDSGGFQMFSLIQKNKSLGKINKDGVRFNLASKGGNKKYEITPEKCIQIQFDLNSDIMVVLDYFTPHNADEKTTKLSVDLTLDWAERCKIEFEKQCLARKLTDKNRPHLFGVVQGGSNKYERMRCSEGLQKIEFDGYGYGGWPFDEDNNFDLDLTKFLASILPNDKPKYGLGVGSPHALTQSFRFGWNLFDCVLPTRDARHKRLYIFKENPHAIKNIFERNDWHGYLYIARDIYREDNKPISEFCECYTCKNYSRGYLNHLFTIEDSLAWRLSTIHNLYMYSTLLEVLSKQN